MSNWLKASVALITCLAVPSAAQMHANGRQSISIVVDFNFVTGLNQWRSSGAFVDQGTIQNDDFQRFFTGAVAHVIDSPQGQNGSFTWTFKNAYTSGRTEAGFISNGSWEIIDGTGDYAGMTGRGRIHGYYNLATGEVHSEFVGDVILASGE